MANTNNVEIYHPSKQFQKHSRAQFTHVIDVGYDLTPQFKRWIRTDESLQKQLSTYINKNNSDGSVDASFKSAKKDATKAARKVLAKQKLEAVKQANGDADNAYKISKKEMLESAHKAAEDSKRNIRSVAQQKLDAVRKTDDYKSVKSEYAKMHKRNQYTPQIDISEFGMDKDIKRKHRAAYRNAKSVVDKLENNKSVESFDRRAHQDYVSKRDKLRKTDNKYSKQLSKNSAQKLLNALGNNRSADVTRSLVSAHGAINKSKEAYKKRLKKANTTEAANSAKVKLAMRVGDAVVNVASVAVPEIAPFLRGGAVLAHNAVKASEARKVLRASASVGKYAGDKLLKRYSDASKKFNGDPQAAASALLKKYANVKMPADVVKAFESVSELGDAKKVKAFIAKNNQDFLTAKSFYLGTYVAKTYEKDKNEKSVEAAREIFKLGLKNKISGEYKNDLTELPEDYEDRIIKPYRKIQREYNKRKNESVDDYIIDKAENGTRRERAKYQNDAEIIRNYRADKESVENIKALRENDLKAVRENLRNQLKTEIDRLKNVHTTEIDKLSKELKSKLSHLSSASKESLTKTNTRMQAMKRALAAERYTDYDSTKLDAYESALNGNPYKVTALKSDSESLMLNIFTPSAPHRDSEVFKLWSNNLQADRGAFEQLFERLSEWLASNSGNKHVISALEAWIDELAEMGNDIADKNMNSLENVESSYGFQNPVTYWLDYCVTSGKISFSPSDYEFASSGQGESDGLYRFVNEVSKRLFTFTKNVPTLHDTQVLGRAHWLEDSKKAIVNRKDAKTYTNQIADKAQKENDEESEKEPVQTVSKSNLSQIDKDKLEAEEKAVEREADKALAKIDKEISNLKEAYSTTEVKTVFDSKRQNDELDKRGL